MRDASLDEFVDAGDDDAGDGEGARGDDSESEESDGVSVAATADRPDGDDSDHGEGGDVADGVEVATVTYEWTPDGAPCGSCASVVESRWRDEEGLVCAGCKRW